MVTVTIRVVDVAGVSVRVFDGSDAFITEGITGSSPLGEVGFSLTGSPTGTHYRIRMGKNGWSFIGSSTQDITVFDPPSPPNIFEFEAYAGPSGVETTLVVTEDTVPIPAVRTRIFSAADIFLGEMDTDSDGEALVYLVGVPSPGTEYIVRLYKAGYTFTGGPTHKIYVIDHPPVGQTNIFDFEAHHAVLPESTHPAMCRVSGRLVDAALRPAKDVALRFLLRSGFPYHSVGGLPFPSEPSAIDALIISNELYVTTDKNGYVEFELPREGVFDLHVGGLETPGPEPLSSIYVPDMAGVALVDLLFPYVQEVSFSEPSLNLTVGEAVDVSVTALFSNTREVTDDVEVVKNLLIFPFDPTVINVTVKDTGVLQIQAIGVGTQSLSAERSEGTFAPRVPAIPDLVIAPIAITVT